MFSRTRVRSGVREYFYDPTDETNRGFGFFWGRGHCSVNVKESLLSLSNREKVEKARRALKCRVVEENEWMCGTDGNRSGSEKGCV